MKDAYAKICRVEYHLRPRQFLYTDPSQAIGVPFSVRERAEPTGRQLSIHFHCKRSVQALQPTPWLCVARMFPVKVLCLGRMHRSCRFYLTVIEETQLCQKEPVEETTEDHDVHFVPAMFVAVQAVMYHLASRGTQPPWWSLEFRPGTCWLTQKSSSKSACNRHCWYWKSLRSGEIFKMGWAPKISKREMDSPRGMGYGPPLKWRWALHRRELSNGMGSHWNGDGLSMRDGLPLHA